VPTSNDGEKKRTRKILGRLRKEYPDARCLLDFETPLQLLVATILSAQCTDERVNKLTPELFRRYPDAEAFVQEEPRALEKAVRPTGFYRNKARNIQACCRALLDDHEGEVPSDMDVLVKLPGVGRKTANCVMAYAWGQQAIIVDTHVKRLSHRLGLSGQDDPDKIELDLRSLVPKTSWTSFSMVVGFHGRRVCTARKPHCDACVVADLCPSRGLGS